MIRDTNSKALLETDVQELKRYRAEKRREKELQDLKSEVKSLGECINRLKQTVSRIESR
jgi:wobble nucleotide-excising tRNase